MAFRRAPSSHRHSQRRLIRKRKFKSRLERQANPYTADEAKREEHFEFYPEDYFRPLGWPEVFGVDRAGLPIEVDLGAGFGALSIGLAQMYPDRNILAVEREGDRVDLICRKAAVEHTENMRVLHLEASYTVEYVLPRDSVAVIHLLFPDPWPKARHHKRRIVTEGFLSAIWNALTPGGEFRFATDSADYLEWTNERLASSLASGVWQTMPYPPPEARPQTDFEKTWISLGRELNYLCLRKVM